MPRRGRLFLPGGCYHVIGRGLERRYIFEDAVDKRDFLSRFGGNLLKCNAQCLAWALMSNHYHFLVRVSDQPLSRLMAPVLGGFAGNYNRRHNRSGYVFQNRFTSILCDEEHYLLQLVRYIHMNPVRAGMIESVAELARYPWTGHSGMLGRHRQKWHDVEEVLRHFGSQVCQARRDYVEFVQGGIGKSGGISLSGGGLIRSYGDWESVSSFRSEHRVCIGDERILGESDFVKKSLQEDELKLKVKTKLLQNGWSLEKLATWVSSYCEVSMNDLQVRSRGDSTSKAKALLCYLATTKLGIKSSEIASYLKISRPAVSKWIVKGRSVAEVVETLEEFD